MEKSEQSGLWRFANAQFDEARMELKVDGQAVELDAKPRAVLLCLLQAEGELVTKDELLNEVWAGQDVSEAALSQAVKRLRVVLGDAQRNTLSTVHGLGFRLNVPIAYEATPGTALETQTAQFPELKAQACLPGRKEWVLIQRLQKRLNNELWLATHLDGRQAVVKFALSGRAERALRREATLNRALLSQLTEPHLVPVLDWQFSELPGWIMMPWFSAGNLAQWSERDGQLRQLPLKQRVDLVIELAQTLAEAHKLGVLHRDIKPGNLLVDDQSASIGVLLSDFGNGSARDQTRLIQTGVTMTGFTQTLNDKSAENQISGTPAYLAPEVVAGGAFTEQADIYSLGIVLYQLISGEINRPLAPGWEEDVSDPGLRKLIAEACAGRPERRFKDMQEMVRRLRDWNPTPWPQTPVATAPSSAPASRSLKYVMVTAVALMMAVLVVILRPPNPINSEADAKTPQSGKQSPSEKPLSRFILMPMQLQGIDEGLLAALHGLQDSLAEDLGRLPGFSLIRGNALLDLGMQADEVSTLAKSVNATLILRGSIALENDMLQVDLQAQNIQSGEIQWHKTLSHARDELYSLQRNMLTALAQALGQTPGPNLYGQPAQQSTYADYLAALAFYQRQGAYTTGQALEFLRLSDIALSSNPHLAAAHLLAIRGTIDAFDSSAIDAEPARQRVAKSLLELETLGTPAPLLAFAHAYRAMYLDWNAAEALQIFEPYWPDLAHLPQAMVFYANLLEGNGDMQQLSRLLKDNLETQPTDIGSIDYLANFHLVDRKDAVAAMNILATAKARFPQDTYLSYLYVLFGVYATGDQDWIQQLLRITERYSPHSLSYLRPRLNQAFREGDDQTLLKLAEQIPDDGYRTNGYHGLRPNQLTLARVLYAANAPAEQVQHHAQLALDAINARRRQSDSPNRMASASIALALLGRDKEALELINSALAKMPASRNEQGYDSLLIRANKVFALLEDDQRLLDGLQQLYGPDGYTQGDCWVDYGSVLAAPIMRRPQAASWMHEHCGAWQNSNREALRAFLPN